MRRHGRLFRCLWVVLGVALSSRTPVEAATVSSQFQGWANQTRQWVGTVQTSNSRYSEGDTLPIRFTATLAAGTVHTVLLRYDFSNGGSQRFFDYLGSFNATVSSTEVNLATGVADPGSASSWTIPADTSLPPGVQTPGALSTYNISALSFGNRTLINGVKTLPVTFTVAGGGRTSKTVVIGYGGHLASASAWGTGNGASLFPGASRKAYASLDGASALNVSVNPGVVLASADLSLSGGSTPEPVRQGEQLTYTFTVLNQGPNAASGVTLLDTLPAGLSLVSASSSQGTVAGSATVTAALGTLNAGSSATVTIVATVSTSLPPGTLANTATVSSPLLDPNQANNKATVLSTVVDRISPVLSCPSAITVATDPGTCGAKVNYSVGAVDNSGSATVVCTPPSGSVFQTGTTTVRCTATDPSGNTSECSFDVTVLDQEAPVIGCPGNLVADFGAGGCLLSSVFACPTAFDNCDGPVAVVCDPPASALLPLGDTLVTCTAVDGSGNTASCSFTVTVRDSFNQSWPLAMAVALQGSGDAGDQTASLQQCLTIPNQARWFKFKVQPGSRLQITLSGLSRDYDLVLFKDIAAAYRELNSPADLVQLSAAFAGDAFSPAAFAEDAFSPGAFAPGAFAPGAFAPGAFAPGAFAPGAFAPGAFAPDSYAPGAFAPGAFAPGAFAPGAFAPEEFAPGAFAPGAFAGAQLASVLAVSAFDGIANETIIANTWDFEEDFYVRVKGRNGAFNPGEPFTLNITQFTGACEGVSPVALNVTGEPLQGVGGDFSTIILTDYGRWLGQDSAARASAEAQLAKLAQATKGVVVDVGADASVAFFNAQADERFDCPYAKNLVAKAIRDIINRYGAVNPLEYVVLVGNDNVIPFFRYPDEALLGPERNYVPPVLDGTASQASLRLGYVLSQDAYGAACELGLKTTSLPLPDLAVGRLVESLAEVSGMIDAYIQAGGSVSPASSLVTGYDFLTDAAEAVQQEFVASLGTDSTASLISANTLAPAECWTADNLRALLFGQRHDLIFLAGHFSAVGALAADYSTYVLARELQNTQTDFENSILFSAGCHSGYNIVDAHAVPYVTLEPDWAQVCARKRATLVAGTGYQYGDTDFIEYGERLYLGLAQQLRTGTGPIPLGKALLRAKRGYLEATPALRPIHVKSYLQATLFGIPTLSVNLPGPRRDDPAAGSELAPQLAAQNPGTALGLKSADLTVLPALVPTEVPLKDINDGTTVIATYLAGGDGVVNNPVEPILPLEVRNVQAAGTVLRGVGFRGGVYTDLPGKLPLTGAAATEIRGVHASFSSEVFFPIRPWNLNYFGALCGGLNQSTLLMAIPAQFKSDSPTAETGTFRQFQRMDFRLFYSDNITAYTYKDGTTAKPGAAAPPALSEVRATTQPSGETVVFQVRAAGDPAAGMQSVWITYTVPSVPGGGTWESLDLTQDDQDSTLWVGTLPLNGALSQSLRYFVQAVNGVGGVTLDTKLGAFYAPDEVDAAAQLAPTKVEILDSPSSGAYGTSASFRVRFTDATGSPLAGQRLVFRLGSQEVWAFTDSDGIAKGTFSLLSQPGDYELKASFPGSAGWAPSFGSAPFTVTRQSTSLSITPQTVYVKPGVDTGIIATLKDGAGNPMFERTVFFVTTGPASYAVPVITDANGRAFLGSVPLGAGTYTVTAYFNGQIPLPADRSITIDDGFFTPSTTAGILTVTLVVDDRPPQITCPSDVVQSTDPGQCSAVVTYSLPSVSDDHAGSSIVCTPPSGSTFPKGTTQVLCVATDLAGNQATCKFSVTVNDTEAPALVCPGDVVVQTAPGQAGAVVTFALSASDNCPEPIELGTSIASGTLFPVGTTEVNAAAIDAAGNVATCSFKVTVQDRELPSITTLTANPAILSPPNHQMIPVQILVGTSDNSGAPTASAIVQVVSSEPDNGLGDGDQADDWQITGPLTVNLRSERAQSGPGRTYTITVRTVDASGNAALGTVTVFVPRNGN